jgi:esterase
MAPVDYRGSSAAASSLVSAIASACLAAADIDPADYSTRDAMDRALAARVRDDGVRQFLLTNVVRTAGGLLAWRVNTGALSAMFADAMSFVPAAPSAPEDQAAVGAGVAAEAALRAQVPLTVIRGARSPFVELEHLAGTRALFPNTTIATVEDAGHYVHADAPWAFQLALRHALR